MFYLVKSTPLTVAHAPAVNEAPVAAELITKFAAGNVTTPSHGDFGTPKISLEVPDIFTFVILILEPFTWLVFVPASWIFTAAPVYTVPGSV